MLLSNTSIDFLYHIYYRVVSVECREVAPKTQDMHMMPHANIELPNMAVTHFIQVP